MLSGEDQLREMDLTRRRAYTLTALVLSLISLGFTLHDVFTRNWLNLPSSLLSLVLGVGILLAIHLWKFSTERVNYGIALGILVVAVPEFAPTLQQPEVALAQYLSFVLITALWFGLLPGRAAALLALVGYAGFAALVLSRPVHDPWLLLHLGSVTAVVGMVASFGQQVSSKRQQAAQFQHQALTDALTGLPNRRAVMAHLEQLLAVPKVSKTFSSFALLMLDIDHFKGVNDQYTHTVGDQVLVEVGPALRAKIGEDNQVARWGGEEFMIVLPNTTAHQAYALAASLHGQTFTLPGTLPSVQFSGGGVLSHEAGSLEELLTLVDRRLHTAKRAGRNQIKWNDHLDVPVNLLPPVVVRHPNHPGLQPSLPLHKQG